MAALQGHHLSHFKAWERQTVSVICGGGGGGGFFSFPLPFTHEWPKIIGKSKTCKSAEPLKHPDNGTGVKRGFELVYCCESVRVVSTSAAFIGVPSLTLHLLCVEYHQLLWPLVKDARLTLQD